jgi:putative ABC transport system substrate-binding protein
VTTRRQLLVGSGAALFLAAARVNAQSRIYRMGFLSAQSPAAIAHLQMSLFTELRKLGYTEGQNLIVERRFAEGRLERLPALARELVALKPDVIFAGASQAALAAARATSTIPIVFVAVSDPVGLGIVKSLARPGTNATGLSAQNIEVHSKRLQLLKEVFPSASRVTVLHNPLNVVERQMLAVLKEASGSLNIELRILEIRSEQEFDVAFKTLDSQRPDVLYVLESPFTFLHRARIVELVNARRLHAVYGLHDYVHAGGLMAYAFPLLDHYRTGAEFVAKVLKGAKPADLPVEQPTRFELIINLKTAKVQDVTFPPAILTRADRVIE